MIKESRFICEGLQARSTGIKLKMGSTAGIPHPAKQFSSGKYPHPSPLGEGATGVKAEKCYVHSVTTKTLSSI